MTDTVCVVQLKTGIKYEVKIISMAVFSALTLGVATSASAESSMAVLFTLKERLLRLHALEYELSRPDSSIGASSSGKISADGKMSSPVGFDIELNDCS